MSAITPIAKTVALTPAGSTTANVANVATGTNTFQFTNSNASVCISVGVFSSYDSANTATFSDAGVVVPPLGTLVVSGNFGMNPNPGTVYVAAATAGDPATVYATPVAP